MLQSIKLESTVFVNLTGKAVEQSRAHQLASVGVAH
jgi:hypothetical protein